LNWKIKMSQTLVLDTPVTQIANPTSSQVHDQEREVSKRRLPPEANRSGGRGSILAAILSTLLLRIASRTSFVLLGFYLGEHFTSATVVALVLEAFYITELILAPIVGSLSDRVGRKPFLLSAPLVGSVAALCLTGAALLFPHPQATPFDARLVVLLMIVLVGRLLEGAISYFFSYYSISAQIPRILLATFYGRGCFLLTPLFPKPKVLGKIVRMPVT
jgi:MFS family permease